MTNTQRLHNQDARIVALQNFGFEIRVRRTDSGDRVLASLFNITQLLRHYPLFQGRARYRYLQSSGRSSADIDGVLLLLQTRFGALSSLLQRRIALILFTIILILFAVNGTQRNIQDAHIDS